MKPNQADFSALCPHMVGQRRESLQWRQGPFAPKIALGSGASASKSGQTLCKDYRAFCRRECRFELLHRQSVITKSAITEPYQRLVHNQCDPGSLMGQRSRCTRHRDFVRPRLCALLLLTAASLRSFSARICALASCESAHKFGAIPDVGILCL